MILPQPSLGALGEFLLFSAWDVRFDSINLPVSLLHATEHEQVENGACKHSPHHSPEATEQRMSPPLDPFVDNVKSSNPSTEGTRIFL